MRSTAAALLLLALAGCGKKETPEYRLSAEQMAWQPYHVGDVLRFGQARSSKVRTFSITEVDDRIVELCNCGGIPVLAGPTPSRLQQIRVDVLRTDTVRYVRSSSSTPGRPDSIPMTQGGTLLEMSLDDNHGAGPVVVRTQLYWDFGFYNNLPVQEAIAGKALPDTTARVLPSLRVGGVSYGPVIQVSNSPYAAVPTPRTKPIRRLYYAKGVGVVAFLEGGTLWYRLP
ncbi:hypothetical protein ACFST9_24045 [Hymenobacter monticola]|uniref:Uncharacterized protein n=1 Tax=Hymenobacter monticola TaxID=1705399 RepID=A0ABY4B3V2_9BACT|nr:hypothetical protein [Hymenobacter monticola]UOE33828.1 hypothetical protein MTP16_22280 [Hymenobacter monticola]